MFFSQECLKHLIKFKKNHPNIWRYKTKYETSLTPLILFSSIENRGKWREKIEKIATYSVIYYKVKPWEYFVSS